jgi:hypothetical protein
MASSGMLCHLALVRTDVSEELRTFFIRLTRIGELGRRLTANRNRRTLQRSSSETSVLTRSTRRNTPEDAILHRHFRENLKSSIDMFRLKYFANFVILPLPLVKPQGPWHWLLTSSYGGTSERFCCSCTPHMSLWHRVRM